MNELRRIYYTDALGVDIYVPRWRLPGAAPSKPIHLSPASAAKEAPAAPVARPGIVAVRGGEASESEPRTHAPVSADKADAQVQPVAPSFKVLDASEVHAVEFALDFWRINQAVLVVDSRVPHSALPVNTLLTNILASQDLAERLPPSDALNWPMFKNDPLHASLAHAREMVSAFVQSRLDGAPVKCIWLMGAAAYDAVAPEGLGYDQALGNALVSFGVPAIVIPSLYEMLKTPELKAVCWKALRDFKRNAPGIV